MAGTATAIPGSLHPHVLVVAQSGRAMVCFDHATGDPARFVSKRERTGRQNRPLRSALQPDQQAFRLDSYGRLDPRQDCQTLFTYFWDTTLVLLCHKDAAAVTG